MTPTTDRNREKLLRLPAPTLLLGVRSLGVKLKADGDQLDIDAPKGVLTADLRELLKARKLDLLDAIQSEPELLCRTTHETKKPPVIVGESMEEFIASIDWSKLPGGKLLPDFGIPRGDLPPTQKQLDILRKGNCFDIFKTRREASDRIGELIASGALCDFLSLEELERFDPKAPGHNRNRRRFCCCLCGDSKPLDAVHRSMSVDMTAGLYYCHRCNTKGVLREYLGVAGQARTFTHTGPTKAEEDDRWKRWWALAQPIPDTDGADYLNQRGIPTDVATLAGVRCGGWFHEGKPFEAVIFPIKDAKGKLIAAQARSIEGDIKNTRGPRSLGIFFTTPGRSQRLAVVEGPVDGLVLAACDLPAIALCGTSWPSWLPSALVGRDVAMAQDADEAGDKCARELGALVTSWRLRPVGAKDWAELAERDGLDAVCECLMDAMEYAPEAAAA